MAELGGLGVKGNCSQGVVNQADKREWIVGNQFLGLDQKWLRATEILIEKAWLPLAVFVPKLFFLFRTR